MGTSMTRGVNERLIEGVTSMMKAKVVKAVALGLVGLVGCGTDPVPPRVDVLSATGPDSMTSMRTTEGTLRDVPPLSDLQIGFDRPLSVEKLGGTESGNVRFVSGLVELTWEDGPAGSQQIAVETIYSDVGPPFATSSKRPTISLTTVGRMPSGARLRLRLDRQRLFSEDGAPLAGPNELFVETAPFTVRLEKDALQLIDPVLLVFSNRGAPDLTDHITVTMAGQRQEVVVRPANPRRNEFMALMSPGWPTPGRYDVTVDAGAADDLGVKLAAPATLSFDVR